VWQSIFYSAVIGWIVLLAITFAAADPAAVTKGGGTSIAVFQSAMGSSWVKLILIISTIGQLFCGMSCLTSASRMCFAFSRDGALPGWRIWSKVNRNRVPVNAVMLMATAALIITLPALKGNSKGFPVAFFAVVSITVIGLYIAYAIPIYLRLRAGDSFEPGPWSLGKKYKWMCRVAVGEVAFICVALSLPFTPAGVPWRKEFDWSAFNYAPLMVGGLFLIVGVWWLVSAKHKFTGPRRTIEVDDAPAGGTAPAGSPAS
jgi:amino acid transporter